MGAVLRSGVVVGVAGCGRLGLCAGRRYLLRWTRELWDGMWGVVLGSGGWCAGCVYGLGLRGCGGGMCIVPLLKPG